MPFLLIAFEGLPEFFVNLLEDVRYGPLVNGAVAADVATASRNVQFDVGDARTILPPVHLLFHEQVELVGTVKRRAVLIDVILVGFAEPDQGYAALMFDSVTHERGFVEARYL